jgi:hypothetical protein
VNKYYNITDYLFKEVEGHSKLASHPLEYSLTLSNTAKQFE